MKCSFFLRLLPHAGHIRMVMLAHGLICEKVSEAWENRERCSRGEHLTLVSDREDA